MNQNEATEKPQDSQIRLMRMGMKLSIVYWLTLFVILTVLAQIDMPETWLTSAVRFFMALFQIAMSWMIIRLVSLKRDSSFTIKVVLVCVLATLVATLHHFVSYFSFRVGMAETSPLELASSLRNILFWTGPYLGWSALFLALQYSQAVVERERQLSELRAQAYDAQMRALRYQINPHFLFNTLNAVATLIEEREVGNAERMVLLLSTFLRATLALDPMQDITLADELDIQARYLDIERARFSDRLTVELDVADRFRPAKVPSLILQPLVENAVRHGVGALDRAVRIRISAEADRNILQVHVDNDAPEQPHPSKGTGLGLRNVAQRLATRFGEKGALTSGRNAEGRYRATISLPLRFTP